MSWLLYFFAAGAMCMCVGESLFAKTGFDALGALILLSISCMFFCAGAIVCAVKAGSRQAIIGVVSEAMANQEIAELQKERAA